MTQKPKLQCETCKHFDSGFIHGYPWATCEKNWSDKAHGPLFGVLKNWCGNHKELK